MTEYEPIDFDLTTEEGQQKFEEEIKDEYDELLPRENERDVDFSERVKNRFQRFGRNAKYAYSRFLDLVKKDNPQAYSRLENEEIEMGNLENLRVDALLSKYPDVDKNLIEITVDENGKQMISFWSERIKNMTEPIRLYNEDGTVRKAADEKLKSGKYNQISTQLDTLEESTSGLQEQIQQREEQMQRNTEERPIASTERQRQIDNENEQLELQNEQDREAMAEQENEIENLQERMSLRERIKYIFKKYGFTVTAVIAAVGITIGVIVSNLSSGLKSVGKGVGNALKGLGKKLAEILPGMIGAIASFIFKTAGQVVSFVAEHAWLLIVAVVIYAIEKFKK